MTSSQLQWKATLRLVIYSALILNWNLFIPMSHIDADKLKLFTGRSNPQLAQKICDYLQIPLGRGRTELFPDGEVDRQGG